MFAAPIAAVVAAVLCVPLLRAADAPEGEGKKPTAKAGDMHSEMGAINRAYRALNKSVADPAKKDASLASVNEMQLHTVAAKGEIPKTAATQPADKRDQFVAGYRKGIIELLKTEIELEEQIIAGDTAKAAETLKKMKQMEKDGHAIYQPPEDRDE